MDLDIFGIGQIGSGIVVAAIGFGLLYFGDWKQKHKNIFVGIGVIGVVMVLLTPGLFLTSGEGPDDGGGIPSAVQWTVTNTEASTYISEPSPNHFLVQFEYDQTNNNYNNDSEWANITGTIARADTGSEAAFTTCTLVDAGTWTSPTSTWGTRDVIEKNADGSYKYTWTDSNSGDFQGSAMTIPRLDTMRTDTWELSVRPSVLIPDAMDLGNEMVSVFDVGGTEITITFRLTLIDNVSATASSS